MIASPRLSSHVSIVVRAPRTATANISQRYAEEVFWLAIDPATYRSLTLGRGLSPSGFETWIRNLYDKMLLH